MERDPAVGVRSPHPMRSFYNDADPDHAVRKFVPVLMTLRVSADDQVRVADASELAQDLLAQAGLEPTAL